MHSVDLEGHSYGCQIHNDTEAEIFKAVTALGNAELTGLAWRVVPLVYDGARNEQVAPFPCGAACVNNSEFRLLVLPRAHRCATLTEQRTALLAALFLSQLAKKFGRYHRGTVSRHGRDITLISKV